MKGLAFAQSLSALKRDLLVQELEDLSASLARVETELERFSKDHPAVAQLRSIPGVGLRTAEAMVAFLDDPQRFERAKAVGAYFGMVPCQDQSAGANHLGHITRDGSPTVRQLLVEAAWQAVRRSPAVRASSASIGTTPIAGRSPCCECRTPSIRVCTPWCTACCKSRVPPGGLTAR